MQFLDVQPNILEVGDFPDTQWWLASWISKLSTVIGLAPK